MPALPSPGNVVKLNVNWAVDADTQAQTVHFFSYTGAAIAADLSTFANFAVSAGLSAFQALAANTVGMFSATARDLSSAMGAEATAGTPWTGSRAGPRNAPAAAVVVAHSIPRHYRGGHPRTYLPLGVADDILAAGVWSDAFIASVDSEWGNWINALKETFGALTIVNLVNVSYFGPPNRIITGSTGRARTVSTVRAVPIVDGVTGHVTRKIIGSQRRRNRDA